MKEQKELERLRAEDQRDLKRLKQDLRRKEKALAATLLIASKKIQAFWGELRDDWPRLTTARRICRSLDEGMAGSARASKLALLVDVGLTTLLRWRRQFAGDGDGIDQR